MITVVFSLLYSVTMTVQIPADKLAFPPHALDCLDKIQLYKSGLTSIKVLACLSLLRIKTYFVDINLIVSIQTALEIPLDKLCLMKVKTIVSIITLARQLWQREKGLVVLGTSMPRQLL